MGHPERYTFTRDEWCLLNQALCGARLELSPIKHRDRHERCGEALDILSAVYKREASGSETPKGEG